MSRFEPKAVLRKLSPQSQRQLFVEKHEISMTVNWDDPRNKLIEEVFTVWQQLPEPKRRWIDIDLQDINEIATDTGIKTINEAAQYAQEDLGEGLLALPKHDIAVWVMRNRPEIWIDALRFMRADDHPGHRWTERKDRVKVMPKTDAAAISELQTAVSAFFVSRHGRGHHCRVQHYLRHGNQDFFFCALSNYAHAFDCFDGTGSLTTDVACPAFEVQFSYDRQEGIIAIFAEGGAKIQDALLRIFGRIVLGVELPASDGKQNVYALNHLLDPAFRFPTDPADEITGAGPRRLRLGIIGDSKHWITLEAKTDRPWEEMHEMIEKYLNSARLPRTVLEVDRATFAVKFGEHCRHRSVSFDIARPDTCTLRSKPEDVRARLEKYLRRWNLYAA